MVASDLAAAGAVGRMLGRSEQRRFHGLHPKNQQQQRERPGTQAVAGALVVLARCNRGATVWWSSALALSARAMGKLRGKEPSVRVLAWRSRPWHRRSKTQAGLPAVPMLREHDFSRPTARHQRGIRSPNFCQFLPTSANSFQLVARSEARPARDPQRGTPPSDRDLTEAPVLEGLSPSSVFP